MKRHLIVFLLLLAAVGTNAQNRDLPQLSIKTNALGWSMTVTNVAVEIDIAEDWSVNIPVYYSGFDYFTETLKFRTVTVQPEIRYHFPTVTGLFVGAHLGLGWFNMAYGDWRIQDARRPAYGGGFGVGYKLPFRSNPRWAIEFEIGAGVYDVAYDKFYNEKNGPLYDGNIRKAFIGIDNAAVTFSYSIDLKKEGRR